VCDYAGCNGNKALDSNGFLIQNGIVRSQGGGRNTVTIDDIIDNKSTTLLLGEKAANPYKAPQQANEDDMGWAAAFSANNFNTIRFTAGTLLPLKDTQVLPGGTNGAFGSAHPGTWNAVMADGSAVTLKFDIDQTIYSGLGTIKGQEIISDTDLIP
jgi:Protein of unknown function (DUF1559)